MSRWDPDWVVKPGDTLKEWIDENGMSMVAVAAVCDLTPEVLAGVVDGSKAIDAGIAFRLSKGTSIPVGMWLNLQRIFNEGLAAGKKVM